jgi:hypothetical protein
MCKKLQQYIWDARLGMCKNLQHVDGMCNENV